MTRSAGPGPEHQERSQGQPAFSKPEVVPVLQALQLLPSPGAGAGEGQGEASRCSRRPNRSQEKDKEQEQLEYFRG